VVLVTMTDHYIRRVPGGPELLAPLEKQSDPKFVGVELLAPERGPDGVLASVYRAVGTLRTSANTVAVEFLESSLPGTGLSEPSAWLDLVQGQLALGRLAGAEQTLQRILSERPDHALALESLGLARLMAQDLDAAAEHLQRAVELNPRRPEAHYNLGLALVAAPEEALVPFGEAIALRPNFADAWYYRGRMLQTLGRLDQAEAHYRRALEIEPRQGRSYVAIATVLDELGRRDEALRYLRHGSTAAQPPEPVQEALRRR